MNYIAERRQEEKERRRGEILDAAEAVAAEVGWDAVTMDQVARTARLSRALVYVYFEDKADLMFGLGERAVKALTACFGTAVSRQQRGLDQMTAIGRAYIAFSRDAPVYFEVLARCELQSPDVTDPGGHEGACLVAGDALQRLMVSVLETGVRDGSIRADVGDLKTTAHVLWGFTHGVIQLASTKGKILAHHGVDTTQLLDQAIRLATRGLTAER
ncbi:MAG TPA: TetR/AcrR family transcriptional regulator [Steroidobacteraceae bacterium]|nr:TetR/AcrR family transcriptional regulator [Steroidobacteraceae bacterium]